MTPTMRLAVVAILTAASVFSGTLLANGKSPESYIERFVEGEEVEWFGEVVSARTFRQDGETVIEWLCRYYELAEPVNEETYMNGRMEAFNIVIKAKKNTNEQYFVSTLRSPDMPLDVAQEGVSDLATNKHYALRQASPEFVKDYEGKTAVYIGGGRGFVGAVKVIFVDEKPK